MSAEHRDAPPIFPRSEPLGAAKSTFRGLADIYDFDCTCRSSDGTKLKF
jgi:hypothetical protein